ncbi:glycerol-3-phosphate dehydrogenase/oxidase [Hoyosella sp. YIM 151337]|uniref:glycerol-3-phosphate dehydrogenase/oxidase n=1 Tax=Hoyosella sp. YIM 151337 TaxID=2992742 RepID=UPI00223653EB|nr:glycerol-3-phosphate dehydrogenase/oxidase [Hoyosella sp. YIM 151337]MCW4353921.1 glycerol-3-phosphate dehydrogenase/oxidase [Hoyosella sp. YIM 151337]
MTILDSALSAHRRERELAEATDGRVCDVLIIGLGVTGAGAALDAAARGLNVVAVDAFDFAWGTSRWSSKLIHGGLRYLAKGQVGVAYESALERGILMTRTAPHLVRPLPMLLPLLPTVARSQGTLAGTGFMAGDVLRRAARTPSAVLPPPRRLSPAQTAAFAPGIERTGLRGGLLSWDGQLEDDARLVVGLARTAAALGARILTRTRVLNASGDGAEVRDELTGTRHSIKARTVINATGVWASTIDPDVSLRPSRGTHIVLRGETLGYPTAAITMPVPGETNRFVFALPQPDGLVYVGLTDEPADGAVPDVPEAPAADIDFLLDVIGPAFAARPDRADVVGAFAGLRPLLASGGRTADLSRRHAILVSRAGIITVVGGKLTTYRQMAEDAVDAAAAHGSLSAGPCETHHLPIVGAATRHALAQSTAPRRLVRRYGREAPLLARNPELLQPISTSVPVTMAELVFGVTHEGALDVSDLLDRRTRIGLVAQDRSEAESAAARAFELAEDSAAQV